MSEEEKKAIKWFDTERKLVEITNGDNNYFSIILKLIDKQDKVINRLAQWVANLNSMVDRQSVIEIIYKEIENE